MKKVQEYNELRTYLAENHVTVELASRVWRYLEQSAHLRKKRCTWQDVSLLKDLPEILRNEIHQEIYSPVLTRHFFFAQYWEYNQLGVRTICQRATLEISQAPGQYLFGLGEEGKSMFFVADGFLEYEQDEADTRIVARDGWIAEAALWLQWVHHGTMVSKVDVVLYALESAAVGNILIMFTDMLPRVIEYAALFFQACNNGDGPFKITDVWVDNDELAGMAQRAFEPEIEMMDNELSVASGSGDFCGRDTNNTVYSSTAGKLHGWWASVLNKVTHPSSPKSGKFFPNWGGSAGST